MKTTYSRLFTLDNGELHGKVINQSLFIIVNDINPFLRPVIFAADNSIHEE